MSREKAKGTKAETGAVRAARSKGFTRARRIPQNEIEPGQEGPMVSKPDIEVFPGFVLQVKDWKTSSLGVWVDEAMEQVRTYPSAQFGGVLHHRKGYGNHLDWYVTMPYSHWLEYVRAMTR